MSVATLSAGSRPASLRSSTTTALVMALLAATGWTVLSGGWAEASPSAVLVGLAGAVEAVVLARGRVSRRLALLASPLLLFATLLPTTFGTRPASSTGGVAHLLGQYLGAATSGLLGNDSWEFNVSLSALLWVCGAWTAWLAVREGRGALATAPGWAVLAVTVINAPDAANVGLAATMTAVTAIMLIAAVHLQRLNESWMQRRVGVLPGTDGRFAGAAAVGGVVIVLLALVLPPLTSTDLSARLFGFGGSHGGNGAGTSPNGHGLGPSGTVRFSPSTIPGGQLTLSDSPVLTYRSSTANGLYLQMATDGVFDGGNWLPDESALNNGDFAQVTFDAGTIPRDRAIGDGGVGGQQQTVTATVSVTNDTSGINVLPFPGEPDATSVPGRANGLVQVAGGELLTVDTVTDVRQVTGASFVVTATQSIATAAQLRAAGAAYPSFVARDGFLQLSDDGSGGVAVIRSLAAQWTAGTTNPYDAATAIEGKLRDPKLFHYTLKPPQPPVGSGEWPVTYFLATSHQGYCQYFATAMGAMLRALGIPSRLVNGYGPGSSPISAAHGTNEETVFTVTSNDAHTWVEGYFPGYGWVPFEPTPSSVAGNYQPFSRTGNPAPPAGPTSGASAAPTPRPTGRGAASPVRSDGGSGGGGPATVLTRGAIGLAVILVPLALCAAWFLRPRTIRGVWRRIGIVGSLAGVPRNTALTFDEYARRLSAALPRGSPPSAPAALTDIATMSDRALYSRNGVGAAESPQIDAAWRQASRVLPRVAWRALRQRRRAP
jgi:transglutaminase-like putative cysteine protease